MMRIFFILIVLLRANHLLGNEPDSAYIKAYVTDKNDQKNGLHFAWSVDRESWHVISNEYSFLKCDYGSWGSQKKMMRPVLLQDKSGLWHCIWDVNDTDGVFAHAVSSDLIHWQPQSYHLKIKQDEYVTALVPKQTVIGNIYKVSWEAIDRLIQASQLSVYKNQLWSEKMYDDATRFAGLNLLEVTITVHPNRSKKISNMLMGVFLEDLNYAADGGLYAELVQNRGFEYHPSDKNGRDQSWNATKAWTVNGTKALAIDTLMPVHPNNMHYIVLGGNYQLINEGFDGIAVKAGEKYDFSVLARILSGKKGKIRARLIGKNQEVLGEASTPINSTQWEKITAVITATQTTADARLEVVPQMEGEIALDMISLFPQKTFMSRKNGLRADLAQTIADIKPRFVRFPGGCLVHGNGLENMYRWKNTIGPLETRKPQRNLWGYHQSAGLGYYEYFLFCEDIGAEPVPIVPAGVPCQNSARHGHQLAGQQGGIPMDEMDEYVQEVLDLIEWANGDAKTTAWGRKRAEAGHPKPFNLKYLGLGNEELISEVFEERFTMIFNAVKEKHPEITVIGTVGPFSEGSDYRKGWEIAEKLNIPIVDEHYYHSTGWFIHNQDYYDRYDRSKSKVYLGEYAAHLSGSPRPNNLETALAEALYLTALERNGDIVVMASYAPLLGKERFTQWDPDLIYFNNTEVKPTVGYFVQKLYGENAGDEYLPGEIQLSDNREVVRKRIAYSVVKDSQSGDQIIKLVNMLPIVTKANLNTDNLNLKTTKAVKTVLTGNPVDKNLQPVQSMITLQNINSMELPPYSFTVVRFKNSID